MPKTRRAHRVVLYGGKASSTQVSLVVTVKTFVKACSRHVPAVGMIGFDYGIRKELAHEGENMFNSALVGM